MSKGPAKQAVDSQFETIHVIEITLKFQSLIETFEKPSKRRFWERARAQMLGG